MKRTALMMMESPGRGEQAEAWLHEAGWETVRVSSARQLAAAVGEHDPALLVVEGPLASQQPGVEAVQWLRRGGVRVPALFCCGSTVEEGCLKPVEEIRPYGTVSRFDGESIWSVAALVPAPPEHNKVPEAGDLSQHSTEDIFLNLYHRKWSGKLELNQEGTIKTVLFEDGSPIYCSSNILVENFGQFLLRNGRITEIEYAWARKIQMREGIRQGEALVKIGVLSHQDLFRLLREQIKEKVINAFGWDQGIYTLIEGTEYGDHHTRFQLNAVELMVAGRNRFIGREDVHALWGRLSSLWGVSTGSSDELGRATARWLPMEVVSSLSQPQRLSEVVIDQGWEKSYALAVFLVLEKVGILRVADTPHSLPVLSSQELPDEELWQASIDEGQALETNSPLSWDYNTSGETQDMAEALWKTYLRMTGADYFTALGVDMDAGTQEIIAAREELMELYSEHRFGKLLEQARHARALTEIRAKVMAAAATLLDAEARQTYVSQLSPQHAQSKDANFNRYLEAEDAFVAGLEALENDSSAARAHFSRARKLNPHEPVYEMYFGWALYRCATNEQDRLEGQRHIARAVASNPMLDDGYVFLGRIFFDGGDMEEAAAQARTALTFRPDHEAACELLREIEELETDSLAQWSNLHMN